VSSQVTRRSDEVRSGASAAVASRGTDPTVKEGFHDYRYCALPHVRADAPATSTAMLGTLSLVWNGAIRRVVMIRPRSILALIAGLASALGYNFAFDQSLRTHKEITLDDYF